MPHVVCTSVGSACWCRAAARCATSTCRNAPRILAMEISSCLPSRCTAIGLLPFPLCLSYFPRTSKTTTALIMPLCCVPQLVPPTVHCVQVEVVHRRRKVEAIRRALQRVTGPEWRNSPRCFEVVRCKEHLLREAHIAEADIFSDTATRPEIAHTSTAPAAEGDDTHTRTHARTSAPSRRVVHTLQTGVKGFVSFPPPFPLPCLSLCRFLSPFHHICLVSIFSIRRWVGCHRAEY